MEDGVAITLHFKKVMYEKDILAAFKGFNVDYEVANPRKSKN